MKKIIKVYAPSHHGPIAKVPVGPATPSFQVGDMWISNTEIPENPVELLQMVMEGKKLEAIKGLREVSEIGLRDAKLLIDELSRLVDIFRIQEQEGLVPPF
jgi:ribosomal protein L7/L12